FLLMDIVPSSFSFSLLIHLSLTPSHPHACSLPQSSPQHEAFALCVCELGVCMRERWMCQHVCVCEALSLSPSLSHIQSMCVWVVQLVCVCVCVCVCVV